MTSSTPGIHEIAGAANSILSMQPYNSVIYSNCVLSGPGVIDAYDPSVELEPEMMSSFWPGGIIAGGAPRSYAANVINPPEDDADTIIDAHVFSRDFILGATVSEAALRRRQRDIPTPLRHTLARLGERVTAIATEFCIYKKAPLAVVIINKVVRSQVIPVGERTAWLCHPVVLDPRYALEEIKSAAPKPVVADSKE